MRGMEIVTPNKGVGGGGPGCLAEMFGREGWGALEVSDGARNFQNAVVGAGGEAQALNRGLQDFFAFGGNGAVFADQLRRHLRIGVDVFFGAVAFELNVAGTQHAAAHTGGAFDFHVTAQFLILHGRNFDVDVNAIQQRTGNFRNVALDLHRRAVAFALGVSEKSAGTGIHGGGQHEARRKIHGERCARDGDVAVFQRLAHHFQHVALKFRQLVEKHHSVVAERNFSGARDGAAADEACIADGVVRRAVRTRADQAARIFEDSGDAVNARGLDGFFERHRRQNGGDAFGEHGLSGAGRADQQNIVAPGTGDFEGALGGKLAAHVAQIHGILAGFGEHLRRIHGDGLEGFRRVDQVHGLRQRLHAEDFDAFDHGRFPRVGFRHDYILDAAFARCESRGKRAAHGTHSAIERKFAEEYVRIENFAEETSLATGEAQRHGQIERGAFFTDIRWREINGDRVARREIETAIAQSGANAFAAFFHGDVRQADDGEMALVGRNDVYLGFDEIRVNAEHGCAECLEKHPKMPCRAKFQRKGSSTVLLQTAYLKTYRDARDTAWRGPVGQL